MYKRNSIQAELETSTEKTKQHDSDQLVHLTLESEGTSISSEAETDKHAEREISTNDDMSADRIKKMNQHQNDEQDHEKTKERVSSDAETFKLEGKTISVDKALADEMKVVKQRDDHQRIPIMDANKAEGIQAESGKLIISLIELGSFASMPIRELHKLLQSPSIYRLLWPGLQKGYSRIEWTCVSSATCSKPSHARYSILTDD